MLPQTLHVDAPSPHVDWERRRGRAADRARPTGPSGERPRRAGVSSFGISGTNAHVILEEAPEPPAAAGAAAGDAAGPLLPWPCSRPGARRRLRELAGRLAAHARGRARPTPPTSPSPCSTARARLEHRAVVIGADASRAAAGLGRARRRASRRRTSSLPAATPALAKVAFVFPGQGSQWRGHGAATCSTQSPVFAARIAALRAGARAAHRLVAWTSVLRRRGGELASSGPSVVQPALFAVMVSLAGSGAPRGRARTPWSATRRARSPPPTSPARSRSRTRARSSPLRSRRCWRSWPATGAHGRGRPRRRAGRGADRALRRRGSRSPRSTAPRSLSSPASPRRLPELLAALRGRRDPRTSGSRRRLRLPLAPVEPLRERGAAEAFAGSRRAPRDPLLLDRHRRAARPPTSSTPTTGSATCASRCASSDAVRSAPDRDGFGAFVEVSPHPVLTTALRGDRGAPRPARGRGRSARLRRDEGGPRALLLSLGRGPRARRRGRLGAAARGQRRGAAELPTYPFQRERLLARAHRRCRRRRPRSARAPPSTRCSAPRSASPARRSSALHRPVSLRPIPGWPTTRSPAPCPARHRLRRAGPAGRARGRAPSGSTSWSCEAPLVLPERAPCSSRSSRRSGRTSGRPRSRSTRAPSPRGRERRTWTPPRRPARLARRARRRAAAPGLDARLAAAGRRAGRRRRPLRPRSPSRARVRPRLPGPEAAWRRGERPLRRGRAGPEQAGEAAASACTRRCSTPPCTPRLLGAEDGEASGAPGCRSPGRASRLHAARRRPRCGCGSRADGRTSSRLAARRRRRARPVAIVDAPWCAASRSTRPQLRRRPGQAPLLGAAPGRDAASCRSAAATARRARGVELCELARPTPRAGRRRPRPRGARRRRRSRACRRSSPPSTRSARAGVLTAGAVASPRARHPDPACRRASGAWCAPPRPSTPAASSCVDRDGGEASRAALAAALRSPASRSSPLRDGRRLRAAAAERGREPRTLTPAGRAGGLAPGRDGEGTLDGPALWCPAAEAAAAGPGPRCGSRCAPPALNFRDVADRPRACTRRRRPARQRGRRRRARGRPRSRATSRPATG